MPVETLPPQLDDPTLGYNAVAELRNRVQAIGNIDPPAPGLAPGLPPYVTAQEHHPEDPIEIEINPDDFNAIHRGVLAANVVTSHYLQTIPLGPGDRSQQRFLGPQEAAAVFTDFQRSGLIAQEPYKNLGFEVFKGHQPIRINGSASNPIALGREISRQTREYVGAKIEDVKNLGRTAVRFALFVSGSTHRRKKQDVQRQAFDFAAAREDVERAWRETAPLNRLIVHPSAPPAGAVLPPPPVRQPTQDRHAGTGSREDAPTIPPRGDARDSAQPATPNTSPAPTAPQAPEQAKQPPMAAWDFTLRYVAGESRKRDPSKPFPVMSPASLRSRYMEELSMDPEDAEREAAANFARLQNLGIVEDHRTSQGFLVNRTRLAEVLNLEAETTDPVKTAPNSAAAKPSTPRRPIGTRGKTRRTMKFGTALSGKPQDQRWRDFE